MLSLFGVSHHQHALQQLEKIVLPWSDIPDALRSLEQETGIKEALILSTCNRLEIYGYDTTPQAIAAWLSKRCQLSCAQEPNLFANSLQIKGDAAVRHLHRVACGLDSAILGEAEILGQLKKAFRVAAESGYIGEQMQALLPGVFASSKRARNQTGIGAGQVSPASVVARLVQARRPHQHPALNILYLGAGSLNQNIAAHLGKIHPARQWFASKQHAKANMMAALGVCKINFNDIPTIFAQVDVVIAATTAQLPLLGKGLVETVVSNHPEKRFLMLDLAVPRDIEAEIGQLEQVDLLNLSDVQALVNANLDLRRDSVEAAERIIEQALVEHQQLCEVRQMAASIKSFRSYIDVLCEQELQQGLVGLRLGDSPAEVLTKTMQRFANKIMHQPTLRLRNPSFAPEEIHAMVDYLFRCEAEEK